MKAPHGFRRLAAALGRHGPGGVIRIAVGAVRGHGLADALRLMRSGRPAQSLAPRSLQAKRRDLQPDGTVSTKTWALWRARLAPVSAPPSAAPPLVFVIGPGAAEAKARTQAALQSLGQAIAARGFKPDPDTLYVFLKPGDAPSADLPNALAGAAEPAVVQAVTFDLFQSLDESVRLILLPGANPVRLGEGDYIHGRGALKGALLLDAPKGDLRARLLDWCSRRSVSQVREGWKHLGRPLVDIAADSVPSPSPIALARRRRGAAKDGVSAIICTRDKGHLTRQLVRQLLALPRAELAEVVILANGTAAPHARHTLDDLGGDARVRVIRADEPFNFSRLCNLGVAETRGGGPLLFLNDDIAPVSEDWLGRLRARLETPGTGAVGPLLVYPDERVQHAGVYLRLPFGVGHILRGASLPQDDPLGLAVAARECASLTGAVLMVDRAAFHAVGGFDEALALSFQDADLCLKLAQAGLRNVLEPDAVLIHMESVSLGSQGDDPGVLAQRHREQQLFSERWAHVYAHDPFAPAGLDPADESGLTLEGR